MGIPPSGRSEQERSWYDGEEPDPRWSLANERTLLAYVRTALSLLVGGLVIAGSHAVTDAPAWFAALGLPLIALSVGVSLTAKERFFASQRAMRLGEPLPMPRIASILPWSIAIVAAVGLILSAVIVSID